MPYLTQISPRRCLRVWSCGLVAALGFAGSAAANPQPEASVVAGDQPAPVERPAADATPTTVNPAPPQAAGLPVTAGCTPRAQVDIGPFTYRVCAPGYAAPGFGSDRLETWRRGSDGAPTLVATDPIQGVFRSIYLHNGSVWLETFELESHRVGPAVATRAAAPPTAQPHVRSQPPSAVSVVQNQATVGAPMLAGEITAIDSGEARIDLGSDAGLSRGDDITFTRAKVGEDGEEIQVVGHGVIVSLGRKHARVRLNVNIPVAVGDRAERSAKPVSHYPIAPPRVGGSWDIEAGIVPLLGVLYTGAGALVDVSARYQFEKPMFIELAVNPLNVAFGEEGPDFRGGLSAMFGLDLRAFGIGIGAGVSTFRSPWGSGYVYEPTGDPYYEDEYGYYEYRWVEDTTSERFIMPTFLQTVRIGAREGLAMFATSSVGLLDGEFVLSQVRGRFQVPLASRYWLQLGGAGGAYGYARGEIGLRILVRGHGQRGSFFLTPSAGFGGFGDYYGPTVGIKAHWRR